MTIKEKMYRTTKLNVNAFVAGIDSTPEWYDELVEDGQFYYSHTEGVFGYIRVMAGSTEVKSGEVIFFDKYLFSIKKFWFDKFFDIC